MFEVDLLLNLCPNCQCLYTVGSQISCRIQKCNKTARDSFRILRYGPWKEEGYFDLQMTCIPDIGT